MDRGGFFKKKLPKENKNNIGSSDQCITIKSDQLIPKLRLSRIEKKRYDSIVYTRSDLILTIAIRQNIFLIKGVGVDI